MMANKESNACHLNTAHQSAETLCSQQLVPMNLSGGWPEGRKGVDLEFVSEHRANITNLGTETPCLYYIQKNETVFITAQLSNLYHLGFKQVDERYLIELVHFGCTVNAATILQDVCVLNSECKVALKANEWYWVNASRAYCDEPNLIDASNAIDIERLEIKNFNMLPSVTNRIFSPVTHSAYLKVACMAKEHAGTTFEIAEEDVPRFDAEYVSKDLLKIYSRQLLASFDVKKYIENVRIKLERAWATESNGTSFANFLWQKYQRPFHFRQMKVLARSYGADLRGTFTQGTSERVSLGGVHSNSIANIYDAFQRLFFYGTEFVKKHWLFIPPILTARIINNRENADDSVFIFALTLDYLTRFHPFDFSQNIKPL